MTEKYFYISLVLLIFLIKSSFSQNMNVRLHFDKEIPVNFIDLKDNYKVQGLIIGDTTIKKPLIIFIQGSEPIPLFTSVKSKNLQYFLLPQQVFSKTKDFHYLVLSKPGIPISVELDSLTNYKLINKITKLPSLDYLENNNLDFYIKAYNGLINQLLQTDYINEKKIIVIGHSQGSRIGLKVAISNPLVTNLVYLSSDPLGRFYSYYINELEHGTPSDSLIDMFKIFYEDTTNKSLYYGETYKNWRDFSELLIDDFIQYKKPIFFGYGGLDKNCISCDAMEIIKISENLNNLTVKRFEKLDHNFFKVVENKNQNKWDMVLSEIFNWIEEH